MNEDYKWFVYKFGVVFVFFWFDLFIVSYF